MKTFGLIAGFGLAGVLGALVGPLFHGGGAELPRRDDVARLSAELGELRTRVERIADEVRSLRRVPLPPRPEPGAPAPTAPDLPPSSADSADPALEAQVRKLVEKEQKASREAMGDRMEAMFTAREKNLIARMAEDHGLTPYQQDELGKILARRRQAMGEFFRTMFSRDGEVGADEVSKVRAKVLEIRDETDDEIKALLTPEQYETFTQQDRGGRGPMWMGGGGRGPGRDR